MSEIFVRGNDALWRAKQAAARSGMGESSWWRLVAQGVAPKPIKIGCRFTAWRASDVLAFIEQAASGDFEERGGRDEA